MDGGTGEKFCLRWNDFENNISKAFGELRDDKDFFDVTIACDDNQLQAHKVILSACSPFFRSVLKRNPHQHPLLYLKGVKYEEILLVLNFMYHGEVNVAQDELNSFLSVAEDLQVKGLSQSQPKEPRTSQQTPALKRFQEQEASPASSLPHPRPTKQLRPKTSYDQPPNMSDKFQARREIQEIAPQIKTEAPVVLDCEAEPENTQEMVATGDYQTEQDGYEYDQSYQDQNVMYQVGEMDMGQMEDTSQDLNQSWDGDQMQFPCEYCEKVFRNKRSYYNHVNKHKGKTYCQLCSKTLSTVSNLKAHMAQVHQQMSVHE
eukprot:GFUD01020977.1.p1 GENE.GFUD01020977.1~~GFUD01020977.1.p1  ORF type:complete len:317 (-),score=76.49 GFUD01020977.1:287-1237(-)